MLKSLYPCALIKLLDYTKRFHRLGSDPARALAKALSSNKRRQLVTSGIELLPPTLARTKANYVIDVGANTGQWFSSFLSVLDADNIDCFEPNPDAYAQLLKTISSSERANSTVAYNYALGSETGTGELNVTASSDFSSMLPPGSELKRWYQIPTRIVNRITVPMKRLDDCARSMPIDVLKIDVQGFEQHVIAGGAQVLSRTRAILMEVSFKSYYEGDVGFSEIVQMLSEQYHFELYNISTPSRDADYRAGQADAVFINRVVS